MVKLVANPLIQRFRQSLEGVEDVEITLAGAEDVGVAKVVRPEAMANSSSTVKRAKMGQANLGRAGGQGTVTTHQPHAAEAIGGLVDKHIFVLTDRPVHGVTG